MGPLKDRMSKIKKIHYKTTKKTPLLHDADNVDDKYFHFSLDAWISLQAAKKC